MAQGSQSIRTTAPRPSFGRVAGSRALMPKRQVRKQGYGAAQQQQATAQQHAAQRAAQQQVAQQRAQAVSSKSATLALAAYRNTTGNSRSGLFYHVQPTQGGVVHIYNTGQRVFVRKPPAATRTTSRYTPSGGGGYNPGPGDRTRNTDEEFRRPGVKRNIPGRRFKPKVNRFEYPYVPGGSRRRA